MKKTIVEEKTWNSLNSMLNLTYDLHRMMMVALTELAEIQAREKGSSFRDEIDRINGVIGQVSEESNKLLVEK
jgi:hypothetical protein